MAKFVNRAKMTTATTGTGTLTLGAAVDGYQTFAAAGVSDGDAVRYVIEDGDAWEIGTGTYSASGTALSRSVEESSNADSAINLTGNALVFVTVAAADVDVLDGLTATTTELNYVSGVTSPVQTQLDDKVATSDIGSTVLAYDDNLQAMVDAFTLPETDGTTGQVLKTNGEGSLSFEDLPPAGPTIEAIASGTLPNGAPVIVNSNGTVSVVGETSTPISQALGSSTTFLSSQLNNAAAVFDSENNKLVIIYTDGLASGQSYAVIGTVSGTSISFGSPSSFDTALAGFNLAAVFDNVNNKIVIAYLDENNSDNGTAIVGTVSGTSISFGTPAVFSTGIATKISISFSSADNAVVIAYIDQANANYGTVVVGTVSGSSISFGSPSLYRGTTRMHNNQLTYDSLNNKIVLLYSDQDDNYAKATVGTVSGTAISFGPSVVIQSVTTESTPTPACIFDNNSNKVVVFYKKAPFNNKDIMAAVGTVSATSIFFGAPVVVSNVTSINGIVATFDSNSNKVVAFYDDTNNDDGFLRVGTVSGTSISFGATVNVTTASGGIPAGLLFAEFDGASNTVVLGYRDLATSNYGKAIVFRNASTLIETNLTTDNFIGLSAGSYSSSQTATIQLVGSINDAQSGLTAGQKYYVQRNGTLGVTPATPEVYAGLAVASNKIIVKG